MSEMKQPQITATPQSKARIPTIRLSPFQRTGSGRPAMVYATFWIERVAHPDRSKSFLQLQYAQMVLLNFPILLAPAPQPNLSWPHVLVGTLRKVFG